MNTKIIPLLKNSSSILIVCHIRPDGDTLGSGLALLHLCEALNKKADIVTDSVIPSQYSFMPSCEKVNKPRHQKYDLVLVVDCADADRMGKYHGYAKTHTSVNIDHHQTNDRFAKHNIVVPAASSTCEVVFDILESEGVFNFNTTEQNGAFRSNYNIPADTLQKMATCLLTGLSTDTGHFMHSSVNSKVMYTAMCLTELGADVHYVANKIYRSDSKMRQLMLSRALSKMRFFDDDSICIMTMLLDDFKEVGASSLETEGFINYPLSIASTQVASTIIQHDKNTYKVSFRSKGIDVSRIAGVFGGGGHVRAAGCTISGYYEDVVDKLLKAVRDFI